MLLAGLVVEAVDVEADLAEVERQVLGEAQLVGGVGQDGVVDHLRIAVALGLHGRGAEAEFGMFVGAEMIFEDLDPGRSKRLGAPDLRPFSMVFCTMPQIVDWRW